MEQSLRQAEKMHAVGQLAGGIAHDFNNQLGGILGYAELLRLETGENRELAQYADNIILGVQRAYDLTSQLLAFSRKGKYLNKPVDMHRIVFEVVNLLQHSIDKKVSLRQDLRASHVVTKGDPTLLQNAALNIALNARDAMPQGGELVFHTHNVFLDQAFCRKQSFEISPGNYFQLSIRDSGVGMDTNTLEHIFEPFFTTKSQGSGMGLAAVYGAITNHRGSISVISELGQGTTFSLFLPISLDENLQIEQKKQILSIRSAHILLVEDEEIMRDVLTKVLRSQGHSVSVCLDGEEAVALYRNQWQTIDLVILDVIMPKMDGEETFEAVHNINPDVKVLVSSGYSMDGKARSIIAKGARGFIQKPYNINTLLEKISTTLSS